jgi:subtilisin family serine protease
MLRRISLLVLLLVAAAGTPMARAAARVEGEQRYIVVLRADADADGVAADHANKHGAKVRHIYRAALKGYAASLRPSEAAQLQSDPKVVSVEVDQVAHVAGTQTTPTGVDRVVDPATNSQAVPNLTIDGVDDRRIDADIAVIDTGVDASHPDLNVAGGVNCVSFYGTGNGCPTVTPTDPNGHGTHVSGSAAAKDNAIGVVGVAPGARVWSVRVLDSSGSGYISDIVAGINWVTARAATIEVANMSLGCECTSAALDTAIHNSVLAGVTYTVAAGNSAKDASTFSPANHPDVVTVSALADYDGRSGGIGAATCRTGQDDTLADFSNFGPLVEIAAPGVCINSTVPGGGYDSNWSGTSMASPHVAGAAALLASTMGHNPAAIRSQLVATGNTSWFGTPPGHPILDVSSYRPATVAGPEAPPVSGFTLAVTPPTRTVTQGTDGTFSVTVSRTGGFVGPVTLSHTGPSGTFAPNPETEAGSTLTIPTVGLASGSYPVVVTGTGTSGTLTNSQTVTLVVNLPPTLDFSISASPSSRSIRRGQSTTFTITVTPQSGFAGGVMLSVTGSRSGWSSSFKPTSAAPGSPSTLTITTTANATRTTATLTIQGVAGGKTHTTTVTLTVR